MADRTIKKQSVKSTQAPIHENPLAKPEKSKKDLAVKKKQSKTLKKDDDWKI